MVRIKFYELYALFRCVLVLPQGVRALVDVDNTAVVGWATKGTAGPRLARRLFLKMDEVLVQKGCTLEVQYVPTGENPADAPSRGRPGPRVWTPGAWRGTRQRRVLGGARDVEPSGGPRVVWDEEEMEAPTETVVPRGVWDDSADAARCLG